MNKLFKPNLEESQIYGNQVSNLYYLLSLDSTKKIEGMTKTLIIGKIPCVFRFLGIPSGTVELIPRNIPHMVGFGQEKTTAAYRNMHDLNLPELLSLPIMLSDPDMIFRSNTKPNSSIIACKEIEGRNNPIVIAMKIDIKSVLDGGAIVVSGYEKDNSPNEFFTRLYDNGFCIYDGENKGYFEDIKLGTGVRDRLPGPIPASAVTCTVPVDKYLSPKGISPSDNQSILTKSGIVNSYESNTSKLVAIFQEKEDLALKYERSLTELGYHTIIPKTLTAAEITSIARGCNAVVCAKTQVGRFMHLQEKFPNIKKIGDIESYLPTPIFEHKLQPLAEILNKQKTESYSGRPIK